MQEYVEKAYNIFLFLCTNSIKKRFKSKKLKNYEIYNYFMQLYRFFLHNCKFM